MEELGDRLIAGRVGFLCSREVRSNIFYLFTELGWLADLESVSDELRQKSCSLLLRKKQITGKVMDFTNIAKAFNI